MNLIFCHSKKSAKIAEKAQIPNFGSNSTYRKYFFLQKKISLSSYTSKTKEKTLAHLDFSNFAIFNPTCPTQTPAWLLSLSPPFSGQAALSLPGAQTPPSTAPLCTIALPLGTLMWRPPASGWNSPNMASWWLSSHPVNNRMKYSWWEDGKEAKMWMEGLKLLRLGYLTAWFCFPCPARFTLANLHWPRCCRDWWNGF